MTDQTDVPQDVAEAEPVIRPDEQADQGAATDQAEAPEAEPQAQDQDPAPEPDKPKQTPWWQKRIDEVTKQRYEASGRADKAENEAKALRALLEAQGSDVGSLDTPAGPMGEADVQRAAEKLVAQQTFNARCNAVVDAGEKAFGQDFNAAISNLRSAGLVTEHDMTFIADALETDAPEQVLHILGQDPDEAMRIASLTPGRRAIEMNKIAERAAKPAASPARRAPPPIAPLEGVGSPAFDPETAPMAEFLKWREGKR